MKQYMMKAMENQSRIYVEPTEQKTCVEFVCVIIDDQLKWKDNITSVSSEFYQAIEMIEYAEKFSPIELSRLLYHG